jgi:hypothetical protein
MKKNMQLTLVQMNFVLGASSMDRVSRVILAAMAIQYGSKVVRRAPAIGSTKLQESLTVQCRTS